MAQPLYARLGMQCVAVFPSSAFSRVFYDEFSELEIVHQRKNKQKTYKL